MTLVAELPTEYRKGTKVVLVTEIPGVPEGTAGKLGRAVGFSPKRYRVRFENDVEVLSVGHDKLVPAKQWPAFVAEREAALAAEQEAEERAAAATAALAEAGDAAAASGGAEPAGDAAASAAEASPPSASDGGAADEGGGDVDPRLAALMARSKKAREESGVPSPTEAAAPAAAPAEQPAEAAPEPVSSQTDEPTAEPKAPKPEAAKPAAGAPREPHAMGVVAPAKSRAADVGDDNAPPPFVPGPELPRGYFPTDNKVAELLRQFKD